MKLHRSFRLTPSDEPLTKLLIKVGLIRILVILLLVGTCGSYLAWDYSRDLCQKKAQHISCVNNMKQLGLAFRIWSGDNNDLYPFNVSTNNGGTLEFCSRDSAGFDRNGFLSLQVMSNELSTPKILVCPQDKTKHWATNFASLRSENVSYQIRFGKNIDDTHPDEILAVCPVDGNILYCDGGVTTRAGKAESNSRASQTQEPPVWFNALKASNQPGAGLPNPEVELPNAPTARIGLDLKWKVETNSIH